MRRLAFLVAAAVAGFLIFVAPPAAAQSGGLCQLNGTANITPGLSNTSGNFTFTFSGALSGCQSNDSTAPTQGAVGIGQTIVVNGLVAQEPAATGSGSCANSDGSGIAIVQRTARGRSPDVPATLPNSSARTSRSGGFTR